VPIRDHYGQTELGMVIANAWHGDLYAPLKPGSMGRALPGWHADVLLPEEDKPAEPGTPGRVAVDVLSSPMMWFSGYRDAAERTRERFTGGGRWYVTGDRGVRDKDGYFTFSARDDDVILMAGYRIGPHEVESVLEQHVAVFEAGVVGVPDELRGEVVVAYVVARPGTNPSEDLATELQQWVKQRFAAHAYPRVVRFISSLPRTPSGKLQRFMLRRSHQAGGKHVRGA
jgi:acetyl-CoA synthetase